jgi:hypothetical protein
MSRAAVYLDIEKAFDTTWHPGFLYELSDLHFPPSIMKRINSFLSNRKLRGMAEGKTLHTSRYTSKDAARFHPVPYPVLSVYERNFRNPTGLPSPLCRRYIYIYATDRKEGFVFRKLQRGLTAVNLWRERWNIKINEDKT